jgi:hypothetical protein
MQDTILTDGYQPFPVSSLPGVVADFVAAGAESTGADPALCAVPVLPVLAAAIGNARWARLKSDWVEPPCLWAAVVAESGTLKSPLLRRAVAPLKLVQKEYARQHADELAEYESAKESHKRDLADWHKGKLTAQPVEPTRPVAKRVLVGDVTTEALAPVLHENPRGVLLYRDELRGWVASHDRYTGAAGADEACWLSIYDGEDISIDRKSGGRQTIYVSRPLVSVVGSIQPAIFAQSFGRQQRESGLAARLLLAQPPTSPALWQHAETPVSIERGYADLVGGLLGIEMRANQFGEPEPSFVGLSPDARAMFIEWHDLHAIEHAKLTRDMAAAWSKLKGAAVRIALVLHLCRWAESPKHLDSTNIDATSMAAAIHVTEWFKNEARRIYSLLLRDEVDDGKLLETIARKGGSVTPREVRYLFQHHSDTAERALQSLVDAGDGRWEPCPPGATGGRPTRRFTLQNQQYQNRNPIICGEKQSFGFGSNGTEVASAEWGAV